MTTDETLTEETIAELEALEKAATPGPWESTEQHISGHRATSYSRVYMDTNGQCHRIDLDHPRHGEDAALITAVRNALPSILRRLRAAPLSREVALRVAEAVGEAIAERVDPILALHQVRGGAVAGLPVDYAAIVERIVGPASEVELAKEAVIEAAMVIGDKGVRIADMKAAAARLDDACAALREARRKAAGG